MCVLIRLVPDFETPTRDSHCSSHRFIMKITPQRETRRVSQTQGTSISVSAFPFIKIGDFFIPSCHAATLEKILTKYGDVTKRCDCSIGLKSLLIQLLARIIGFLDKFTPSSFPSTELLSMKESVRDLVNSGLDIPWLQTPVYSLSVMFDYHNMFSLNASTQAIEQKKRELSEAEKRRFRLKAQLNIVKRTMPIDLEADVTLSLGLL